MNYRQYERFKLTLAVFLLLGGLLNPSVMFAGDCLDEVKTIYQSWNAMQLPDSDDECYHLKYSYAIDYRASSDFQSSFQTTEVTICGDKVRIESDDLRSYQDEENAVVIMPRRKSVFIRAVTMQPHQAYRENLNLLNRVLGGLFDDATLLTCSELSDDGLRQVALSIKAERQHFYPFSEVRFLLDPANKVFREISLLYRSDSEIERVTMRYHDVNFTAAAPADIDRRALSFALSDDKRLRKALRHFRLVDIRDDRDNAD